MTQMRVDVAHGIRFPRMLCTGGFTLVEVLIAVTIVGLLIFVAWPAGAKLLEGSQKWECINNLQRIESAKTAYIVDFTQGSIAAQGATFGQADPALFRVYFIAGYPETCPLTGNSYENVTNLDEKVSCPTHGTGENTHSP